MWSSLKNMVLFGYRDWINQIESNPNSRLSPTFVLPHMFDGWCNWGHIVYLIKKVLKIKKSNVNVLNLVHKIHIPVDLNLILH